VVVAALAAHAAGADATTLDAAPNACESYDFVGGAADDYSKTICAARKLMKEGKNSQAAELLVRASRLMLFEEPNFRALPDLALTQYLSGQLVEAKRTIILAEYTLGVLVGMYSCVEDERDGHYSIWSSAEIDFVPAIAELAAERMCGAAYDGYYEYADLESFVVDAELVKHYLEIRKAIDSHGNLPEK